MRWFDFVVFSAALLGQDSFVGAMGGIATLSADGRNAGSPPASASSYKPENGASLLLSGGRHISDYFSAHVSYSRNSNDVSLTGIDLNTSASFEEPMRAVLQTMGFEAMGYFRGRESRVRPYLSAGPVVTWLRVNANGPVLQRGNPIDSVSRSGSTCA
jgi:hypothetical protein